MKLTLNPNEITLRTARKHPMGVSLNITPHFVALFILLIFLALSFYANSWNLDWLNALAPILRFLIMIGIIIDWLAIITMVLLEYFLTFIILTNERVIKVKQEGIFSKSIFVSDLGRVQDVKVEQKGIVAQFFNFGTLRISTASEQGEVFFHELPNPADFQKDVFNAINEHDAIKNNPNTSTQNQSSQV